MSTPLKSERKVTQCKVKAKPFICSSACMRTSERKLSFGHTMVETPDPFRTLQLSIIGLA